MLLCILSLCGGLWFSFRAARADHAASMLNNLAKSTYLQDVPAETIISLVNEGQLGFEPANAALSGVDPEMATRFRAKWDDIRSQTINQKLSLEKIFSLSRDASDAHIRLRDASEWSRRWAVVCAVFGVIVVLISGVAVFMQMSQGSEPLVIQKLIVQSRNRDVVPTHVTAGDEWIFDAGRRHFENTFAQLPVACCSFTSDGRITAWNRAMEAATGQREGDVLQRSFWEVMSFEKMGELGQNAMYRLLQGEPVDMVDWVYDHPVGERLDFKATLIPVMGATGGVVSAVAAISDVTLQKRQERLLIENDMTKTAMLAAIPDTLMRLDAEGRLLDLKDNAGVVRTSVGPLIGTSAWREILGEEFSAAVIAAVRSARQTRVHTTAQFHSQGSPERHFDIRVAMCGPSDVLVILHDTTDRHRAETLMRDSEARLRYLIEGSADILTLIDAAGIVTYQSPAVHQALGYGETELVGHYLHDYVEQEDRASVTETIEKLRQAPSGKARFHARIASKEGAVRDLEIQARNLLDNPYVNAIVLNVRDVTERKELERELHRRVMEVQAANGQLEEANKVLAQRATTDGLTGLRNHRTAQEYLSAAVTHCQKNSLPLSLAVIDVDFFKKINDSYGHQEGDRVLQWLAGAVQKSCGRLHLAGRYGGEEFVLVMPETSAEEAFHQVEFLRRQIEKDFDRGYPLTVSIGLVTSDSVIETSASLFAKADKALYASKQNGRNRVTAVNLSGRQAA